MFDQLEAIVLRYERLSEMLWDPEVLSNSAKLREYSKEQAELEQIVQTYRAYKEAQTAVEEARSMQEESLDDDMRQLVREELELSEEKMAVLQEELQILLMPKDPNDAKDVIVEIRGAAGGEEAALFAGDLLRMYTRYAERQGWKVEMIDAHYTDIGGYKEATFSVQGQGAYSKLKYESGAHRVQRIPATESGGRIHTSTATVAVLPEVEEVEVQINDKDLRIDTYCATGPGGQSVNTTQSAVRITHLPSGIVVQCQDEKSQYKNKDKAMRVLRARLHERYTQEQQESVARERRSQVGTGDRSERIRTYNFPQSRVTDHRIGLTLHRLSDVLDGDIGELINGLVTAERANALQEAN